MGMLGYSEEDVFAASQKLVEWGLIEPENLVVGELTQDDAVRMHATGFIHMRFFIQRAEYLVGITPNMHFASRGVADEMGRIWAGQSRPGNLSRQANGRVLDMLSEYFQREYARRCNRHAFYEELGLGGRSVVRAVRAARENFNGGRSGRG